MTVAIENKTLNQIVWQLRCEYRVGILFQKHVMTISFEIGQLFSMATIVMVVTVCSLAVCNVVMYQHITCTVSHVMSISA